MEEDYEAPKATGQDKAIAKYIYNHVPKRIGDLHGMEVDCFYAEDAVNALLDSPWATGKSALFTDRQSVVDFCHELLCKEMYHRAMLAKRKPKPTAKLTNGNDTPGESGTDTKKSKKKTSKQKDDEEKNKEQKDGDDTKNEDSESKKVKKLKKLKLGMADDQYFEDGREVYVWIYEPVSWSRIIIGSTILIGAIAVCCYPLWPEWMRLTVYYLSIGGACFLGVIISLAILRYIVWAIIYAITMGKHSFFLFPNLTEDCGFFESFVPLYEYSKVGDDNKKCKKKKDNKTNSIENKGDDSTTEQSLAGGDNNGTAGNEGNDGNTGEGSDVSQPSEGDDDFEVVKQSEVTS